MYEVLGSILSNTHKRKMVKIKFSFNTKKCFLGKRVVFLVDLCEMKLILPKTVPVSLFSLKLCLLNHFILINYVHYKENIILR
jgi:hypothetical protein